MYVCMYMCAVYLLPAGSWSELIPVVANIFLGAPLALSPFLMIIICVFTDVFSSLALVHEHPEADIMLREPRDPTNERLVDWKLLLYAYAYIGMLETFTGFLMFGLHLKSNGYGPADWLFVFNRWNTNDAAINEVVFQGQSIFFVTLVCCQLGNLFTTRTRHVPILPMPACLGCRTRAGHASSPPSLKREPTAVVPSFNLGASAQPISSVTSLQTVAVETVPSAKAATSKFDLGHAGDAQAPFMERAFPIMLASAAALLVAVLITEVPAINDNFTTRPVPAKYWGTGALGGFCVFFMGEMRKWWCSYYPHGWAARVAW